MAYCVGCGVLCQQARTAMTRALCLGKTSRFMFNQRTVILGV